MIKSQYFRFTYVVLLSQLAILILGLSITYAVDDATCYYCLPGQSITAATVDDMRIGISLEAETIDISISQNTGRVARIYRGDTVFVASTMIEIVESYPDKDGSGYTDYPTWGQIETILQADNLTQIAIHPDGQEIVIGDEAGHLMFRSLEDLEFEYTIIGQASIEEILYRPDGTGIITLEGSQAIGWHTNSGISAYFPIPSSITNIKSVDMSVDGEWLVVGADNNILIYEMDTWSLVILADVGIAVEDVLFDKPESQGVFIISSEIASWRWDRTTNDLVFESSFEPFEHKLPQAYTMLEGAISPDGNLLMTADNYPCIRAWDTRLREEITGPALGYLQCFNDIGESLIGESLNAISFTPNALRFLFANKNLNSFLVP